MKDIFDELFNAGYSVDEVITELRKRETARKDAELKEANKKKLADARTKAVDGLVEYFKVLIPAEDSEKMRESLTTDFKTMEDTMNKLNEIEGLFKKAFADDTNKQAFADEQAKATAEKKPAKKSDDEVLKSFINHFNW